ncbi:MAG: hypothetical protein HKO62_05830 [Gammaproteobacteria bacterium]|nr:hypothetical protein [Gammaproteobacteria bacterium]
MRSASPIPAHFAPLFSRTTLRTAGLLGALGSLLAACGDFSTAWIDAPPPAMNTVMWLALGDFVTFLAPKAHHELLIGHYLGVFFIPLNVLGLWHVYLALAPRSGRAALLFIGAGTFLAAVGGAFHGTVGLAVTAVRAGDATTLAQAADYFEPFGWILTVFGGVVFIALAVLIGAGRSVLPRWMALLSPALTQTWFTLAAPALPQPVGVLLLVTGFNVSVCLFLLVSTAVLWRHDPMAGIS